jgi:hypothetical protein
MVPATANRYRQYCCDKSKYFNIRIAMSTYEIYFGLFLLLFAASLIVAACALALYDRAAHAERQARMYSMFNSVVRSLTLERAPSNGTPVGSALNGRLEER